MRVREWYGWHFPEMGKVVTDNLAYAKTIKKMTYRTNCASTDFRFEIISLKLFFGTEGISIDPFLVVF